MSKHLIPRLALTLGLGLTPLCANEPQAPAPKTSATPAPMEKGQPRGPRSERRVQKGDRMARYLKLTDDQRAKIKALHEKHREELKGHRESTHLARKAFFEAAKEPNTSVDQLRKLHQAMSDQNFDLMLARRALRLETRQVLTPEQRGKASEAQGLMEERMKQRRGHRGERTSYR